MTIQQPTMPTHLIDIPDLDRWLIEHGLEPDSVIEARVVIGRRGGQLSAWLDVDWYKRDAHGLLYQDPADEERAATGSSSIPLQSWPTLSPV